MIVTRRQFLATAAATSAALLEARTLSARPADAPQNFDFIFFTDAHIQPELDAAHGCDMCFHKISTIPADFAIMGGDHVFDALAAPLKRANSLFDLYSRTERILQMPLHRAIGNHDMFGISAASGASVSSADYGKKLYEDRMGKKTYTSFDHKGVHFFILDSVQPTPDRMWESRIDDEQLQWLSEDLKQVGVSTPIIGITHVPMVTAFESYVELVNLDRKYNTMTVSNAPQILKIMEGYNVLAVLQGHTHVNELVRLKNTQFITSGAVCGNWWRGERMGVPEGFSVVSYKEGAISVRYETYGFRSVPAPQH